MRGLRANVRVLFRKNCGTCHRLLAAATHGTVGPNLNYERVSYSPGGGQPSRANAAAVAF
jgi:mono/diheme cytochrome c family protein